MINKKSDLPEDERPEGQPPTEKSYVPASPVKRTLAWIALVYALMFLALTTYYYFRGTMLGNLAPLLVVPGLIGLGVLSLVSWRTTGSPGRTTAVILALICFFLTIVTLPIAVTGLLSNF
ncbi:MAG: hypothetical protein VB071_10435 [Lawsonibacter sp.]|nr:hypothetical protein [Lawsonibacter sp.]